MSGESPNIPGSEAYSNPNARVSESTVGAVKEVSQVGDGGRPRRSRWSSFVADPDENPSRILREIGNPDHRLRVEHDQQTLLIHLSDEDGHGWTVFAIDRRSREWAVAQGTAQQATAKQAYDELHRPD
jgi:hypothetical protein